MVLAHYHPFYPISKDDAAPEGDIYSRRYLVNTGDAAQHVLYGGYLRDRPLPREPLGAGYQDQDLHTEVRRAVEAGLDGFTVDLIGTHGSRSDLAVRGLLRAAADVDPRFTITLMPDLFPSVLRPTPSAMAAYLADLGRSPQVHRTADGRLVVSPFGPDREGVAYWREVLHVLETEHGERVFFVPCLLDYWRNADDFASISAGLSAWGYRNVGADRTNDVAAMADDAHSRHLLWMHPVAYGDVRPARGWFNESANTSLLRHTFATAGRQDAEWIQVITWNDYAEGTFVSPSPTIGWAVLDLVSWYSDTFRTGRPRIARDTIYLSYRTQRHDAPAALQLLPLTARPGTPPRDLVEALVFLRRASTVRITVGDRSVDKQLKAGIRVVTAPLEPGVPEVQVLRKGRAVAAVAGSFPIVETPQVQTLHYYMVSSGRTGS